MGDEKKPRGGHGLMIGFRPTDDDAAVATVQKTGSPLVHVVRPAKPSKDAPKK